MCYHWDQRVKDSFYLFTLCFETANVAYLPETTLRPQLQIESLGRKSRVNQTHQQLVSDKFSTGNIPKLCHPHDQIMFGHKPFLGQCFHHQCQFYRAMRACVFQLQDIDMFRQWLYWCFFLLSLELGTYFQFQKRGKYFDAKRRVGKFAYLRSP